jgi:hypothetical protein
MTIGVLLAVLAPAGAGVVMLLAPARAVAVTAGALATAGAGRVLAETVAGGDLSWRGFGADPWRAGVAVIVAGVALVAVSGARKIERADGVVLASLGAGIGFLFAEHAASAAAFLVVGGAGIAARAVLGGVAPRAVVALGVSDVLAVTALWLASDAGARTPPTFEGVAAWAAGAAALIKLALPGAPPGAREDSSGAADGFVLGAARAHGFVLAVWLVASGGDAVAIMGGAAAWLAVAVAHTAHRRRSWRAALGASALLATAGVSVATPAALLGASLLAIGVGVTAALVLAGERAWAGPSLGAAPLGATFAGAALVASEALARGVVDRPFLLVALPAALAFVWLAQTAAALHPIVQPVRGDRIAVIGVVGALAAVLAIIPGTVIDEIGDRLLAGLTGGSALGSVPIAVGDRLGLLFVLAGAAALVGARWWPIEGVAPVAEPGADAPAASEPSKRMRVAIVGLEAAAAVLVIPAIIVGVGRGFL